MCELRFHRNSVGTLCEALCHCEEGGLEDVEDCDLVICLSHLGYSGDCRLAAEVSDVDVIVGGHSHTDLAEMTVVQDKEGDDVVIVQDGCWGLGIGELKVRF